MRAPSPVLVLASLLALAACPAREPGEPGEPSERAAPGVDEWRAAIDAWRYTEPVPDLTLVAHTGEPLRLSSLARGYVLLGFIYTRCPVAQACPMTVSNMRAAADLDQGRAGAAERPLHLLGLTLDPGHDTPERLRAFAAARSLDTDRFTLATGPEELMISALPSLFGVLALPRGDGDIEHTVKLVLLGPGLRVAKEWKDDQLSAHDVVREIARLDAEARAQGGPH